MSKRGKTALLTAGIFATCLLLATVIVFASAKEEELSQPLEVSYLQELSDGEYLVRPLDTPEAGKTINIVQITRYPFGFAVVKGSEDGSIHRPARQPVAVRTRTLAPSTIARTVLAIGSVEAEHDSVVAVETDGVVAGVPVVLGQEVAEGDPLISLKSEAQTLALTRAEAQLRKTLAAKKRSVMETDNFKEQLALAEETLKTRTRERDRWANLAAKGMASQDRADQADVLWRQASRAHTLAKGAYTSNVMSHDEIDLAIVVAQAARDEAALRLAWCTVRAPFPGVVTTLPPPPPPAKPQRIHLGDFVRRGTPVIRLVSQERMRLRVHVRAEEAHIVRPGAKVEISVPSLDAALPREYENGKGQPGPFPGRVEGVAAAANPRSRKFAVDLVAENPTRLLRDGLFCRVRIDAGEFEQAYLIPDSAVVSTEEGQFVYLVQDAVAHRRAVALGPRQGEGRLLRSGLTGTVELIVQGTSQLYDGAPIRLLGD